MNGLKSLMAEIYKPNGVIAYGISLSEDKIIVPEEFMPIVESISKFGFDGKFGLYISEKVTTFAPEIKYRLHLTITRL